MNKEKPFSAGTGCSSSVPHPLSLTPEETQTEQH